ncbi:MAG: 1-acyl-sn-glycerol-3-phosphate acyltransferase [Clostridia bacterium]|jgi:1-acyl-sn-glycerol-3-phosphate acyltransferase|nr:1-acyl-sn-glycerol-3-phosphate acyltransferase [Clostridia bacterium]MBO7658819.1 1-acyl-sn-glycerol-3-phosphate acyltransferase [Clostridia bacterium]MBP5664868.1 1-acyl-sn-glycerol-3-phosphate acyltransferase [Clostridia bacterium]
MGTFIYDFVHFTACPALLWYWPKKYYENENAKKKVRGGALMISNHNSMADPMYLMLCIWYRRHHYVCAKELYSTPFRRWMFTQFLTIPIDRENFGMSSFKEITGHLKKGDLCVIFPEGHVVRGKEGCGCGGDSVPEGSEGGQEQGKEQGGAKKELEKKSPMVDNLKSGMVLMAYQSGVPVWPVYVRSKQKIFDRLRIAIGEPVDVKALLGNMPTMDRIEEVARMLGEKENYLKSLVEGVPYEASETDGGGNGAQ